MFDTASSGVSTEPTLELRVLACNEREIVVEGWLADLDIRTEPLSEVFVSRAGSLHRRGPGEELLTQFHAADWTSQLFGGPGTVLSESTA